MWLRIYRVNEERRNHIVNVHVGELCSEIAVVNEKNHMNKHVDVGEGKDRILDSDGRSGDRGTCHVVVDEQGGRNNTRYQDSQCKDK